MKNVSNLAFEQLPSLLHTIKHSFLIMSWNKSNLRKFEISFQSLIICFWPGRYDQQYIENRCL